MWPAADFKARGERAVALLTCGSMWKPLDLKTIPGRSSLSRVFDGP